MLIWLLIMLVETVHGVLRGVFMVPRLGEAAAEQVGWPVAAILVMVISVSAIRWTGLTATAPLLRLGAAWALLTLLFEIVIGLLRGLDPEALLAALDPRNGTVAASAALMFVAPLLAARLRGLRQA